MRELSMSELELVSGGYNTYDLGWTDPVTPPGGGGGGGDWGDWGDWGWGDYGDGGGGGGGGGGSSIPQTNGQDPTPDCAQDAMARQALDNFKAAAALLGEDFAHRERSYFVVRNDDGSYALTGYSEGPSVFSADGAMVIPNDAGLNPLNVVGFIHNHPSGTTMSGPDRDLLNIYQNWIWENGGSQEFKMWMISADEKIEVYDKDNMNNSSGVDVTKCP